MREEETILARLSQYGREAYREFVVVLLDTGLRPSEARNIRGCDVSVDTARITVPKTKTGIPRQTIATARVLDVLRQRMQRYGLGKLWPDVTKRGLRDAWELVRADMGRSEDRAFVPYLCRHTFATRLVQRGVPIDVVSRLLGHTNIQMTMRYAKRGNSDYDAALSVLDKPTLAADIRL